MAALNRFDFVIDGRRVGAIGITYPISLLSVALRADTPDQARERLFSPAREADEYRYSDFYELHCIRSCRLSEVRAS